VHDVDEVKEIRDSHWSSKSREAKNVEAEGRCCEIWLRADRNAVEILRQMEKATRTGNQYIGRLAAEEGTNPKPKLGDLGIRHNQSSRWQRLDAVPLELFEAALAAPDKQSIRGIIAAACPVRPNPVSLESLWLWDDVAIGMAVATLIPNGRPDPSARESRPANLDHA
jgi:hypothetical protein